MVNAETPEQHWAQYTEQKEITKQKNKRNDTRKTFMSRCKG